MASEWGPLAAALAVGLITGALYFGGLWLTLRFISRFRHPALAAAGSLALRLSAALIVLYVFSRGDPVRIGSWLVGFLASRVLLVRISGQSVRVEGGG
jgi:F1F0 ATPase subunit 2